MEYNTMKYRNAMHASELVSLADLRVVALTVYGEARGEEELGQKAVLGVITNRWDLKLREDPGITLVHICQAPKQFSCWNADDPNLKILLEPRALEQGLAKDVFRQIFWLTYRHLADYCDATMEGKPFIDVTNGCTHYCAKNLNPYWAEGLSPEITIGGHKFFKGVK